MAKLKEHIKDCEHYLGYGFADVHRFLDHYTKDFPVGKFLDYHRTFLHNEYGLAIVRKVYKEEGELAAKIHLFRDYTECPIQHLKLNTILDRFGRVLIYFNKFPNVYPEHKIKED